MSVDRTEESLDILKQLLDDTTSNVKRKALLTRMVELSSEISLEFMKIKQLHEEEEQQLNNLSGD